MDFGNAQKSGDKLLTIFSSVRLQDWDIDHMAQHYVHNAYPLDEVVDKVFTFSDCVKYHYNLIGVSNDQYTLF